MTDGSRFATGVSLLVFGLIGMITGIILSLTIIGILIGIPVAVLSVLMIAFGISMMAGTPSPARQAPQQYCQQHGQPAAGVHAEIAVLVSGRHVSSLPMIAGGVYTIGRGADSAVILADPGVSTRHALLSVQAPGQVSIEDLGSTNGVFINGNRIAGRTAVGPGSSIRLGAHQVVELSW